MEREVVFKGRTRLTRYVYPEQRFTGKRASPDAFVNSPMGKHLSVHLVGLASKKEIASLYRQLFQSGKGKAAFCVHSIYEYNTAADATKGHVGFNEALNQWEFTENDKRCPAYKHHPVSNKAHCGIEYVRVLDTTEMLKVARRLARKKYVAM